MVLVNNGSSYAAIGWRPANIGKECKGFPYISDASLANSAWKQTEDSATASAGAEPGECVCVSSFRYIFVALSIFMSIFVFQLLYFLCYYHRPLPSFLPSFLPSAYLVVFTYSYISSIRCLQF